MGIAEDFFHRSACAQLLAEIFRVAFVSQRELVAQIIEAVIYRSSGQHQNLGFNALADDLVHQFLIAGFPVLDGIVVSEIVRFIDDDQIIITPVNAVQRNAERLSRGAGEVGVAQNVIIEAIPGEDVGRQVAVVVQPVVREFLGAQHQHRAVAQFVIFHNGQSRECFTKPHAVGQDAAVVSFQLIDNAYCGITLKIEKLVPDQRALITRAVVGQDVFIDIIEEIPENIVEHQEIDALRRIFLIDRGNMITDCVGHIFKFCWVIPDLFK